MKDINKRSDFEKEWEEAFKDAEIQPSERMWDKIDAAMSKEEAGLFQRKAFIYKMLAAASIAAVMAIGLFSANYYLTNESDFQNTSLEENQDVNGEGLKNILGSDEIAGSDTPLSENENETGQTTAQILHNSDGASDFNESTAQVNSENRNESDNKIADDFSKGKPTLSESDNSVYGGIVSNMSEENALKNEASNASEIHGFQKHLAMNSLDKKGVGASEEMPLQLDHIYKIPVMPRGASKKKKDADETGIFLAGLDFSTGVFDPNFQQRGSVASTSMSVARVGSTNDQLTAFNTANQDFLSARSAENSIKPEVTYSYGANVGFKLTNRFIVQTGFGYQKANSTTTTSGYVENHLDGSRIPIVSSYQYQLEGLTSYNKIAETDLDNQYEFASIPLRAGYIVLDKKFNVTVMAGVSSEFFLNNRIVDDSDFLNTLTNGSGSSSPYKNVYFNGSFGTMMGYTIAKNYVLTLEPAYRFAINSFTKEDFYLNSMPSSFMVSFGVAYNFK